MKPGKVRPLAAVMLPFAAAGAVFCSAAFVNNVFAVVNWWRAFLGAGGDGSKITGKIGGVVPWLDWSVVDYSAVTTLIPAIGFICMTRALVSLLSGRISKSSDFPFFKGSDQFNIALGLFGTLWGIIVIGYYKLDTVSMADLMQCLHTALFSTLAAVVWVFLVDRPLVRPVFVKMLESAGLSMAEEGDVEAAVAGLVERIRDASEAFDKRQKAYEEALESRSARYAEHFEKRLACYEREFEARRKEYEDFFTRRISELESRATAAEGRLAKVSAALGS